MIAKELRELSVEELKAKLEDCREELFNLRFQQVRNMLENPGRFNQLKKEIARIHTVLTEMKQAN
ncbi:50S ribosomal protein L29 [bacterium]|nr:50S ribosomal protein L29 [bacterium]